MRCNSCASLDLVRGNFETRTMFRGIRNRKSEAHTLPHVSTDIGHLFNPPKKRLFIFRLFTQVCRSEFVAVGGTITIRGAGTIWILRQRNRGDLAEVARSQCPKERVQ